MPMLAAEMASVTAKPRMILKRSRRVGSFDAIDVDPARSEIPTPNPRLIFPKQAGSAALTPDPVVKNTA